MTSWLQHYLTHPKSTLDHTQAHAQDHALTAPGATRCIKLYEDDWE